MPDVLFDVEESDRLTLVGLGSKTFSCKALRSGFVGFGCQERTHLNPGLG
jgi:hypothetical protein